MLTDQRNFLQEVGANRDPLLHSVQSVGDRGTLSPKWVVSSKLLPSGPRKLFVRGAVGMEDTQETRPSRHSRTVHIGTPGD